mmetsp:Transcript_15181/g.13313  ORF Transcript_15181/g.13313 Transcript_15181/m.13313 type:complete len:117 (-) Transcript_15181:59-409(-)
MVEMGSREEIYQDQSYTQPRRLRLRSKTPKKMKERSESMKIKRTHSCSSNRFKISKKKPKQKEIYQSVKRVKDLTEKCLNGILNSTKFMQKSKKIERKRSISNYKSQPRAKKMKSK